MTVRSSLQEDLMSARSSKHRIGRSANTHVQLVYSNVAREKRTHSKILSKFKQHPPLSSTIVGIIRAHLASTLYSVDNILSRGCRAHLNDRRPPHITNENLLLPSFPRLLSHQHIVRGDRRYRRQSGRFFTPVCPGIDRNLCRRAGRGGPTWMPIIFIQGSCLIWIG